MKLRIRLCETPLLIRLHPKTAARNPRHLTDDFPHVSGSTGQSCVSKFRNPNSFEDMVSTVHFVLKQRLIIIFALKCRIDFIVLLVLFIKRGLM